MDNKRKIELLNEVITTMKADEKVDWCGICYQIERLRVKYENKEVNELLLWFSTQKPRKGVNHSFTKHHTFTNGQWWWTRFNSEATEQRLLYLNHLIKTLT